MRTKIWVLGSLLVGQFCLGLGLERCTAQIAAEEGLATTETTEVEQLIQQLGHEEYLQRQLAELRLVELGDKAVKALHAARDHADLEIATRAKYILTQVPIVWSRASDSETVRKIMSDFGKMSQDLRLQKILELVDLEKEEGFGALCRIARLDSSPLVARRAALEILREGILPAKRRAAAVAKLRIEIGEEDHVPVSWVALYADQLESPQKTDTRWLPAIDHEMGLLAKRNLDTNTTYARLLLQNYIEIGNDLSDVEAIVAGWQRHIRVLAKGNDSRRREMLLAINWHIQNKQWKALQQIEGSFAELIEKDRALLYFVAIARSKEGRAEEAEEQAERALRLQAADDSSRSSMAISIAEFGGRHDWAEREWQYVIANTKPTDYAGLKAREYLASFRLSDRLEYKAAADLVGESLDAIGKSSELTEKYKQRGYFSTLQKIRGDREFYLASYYKSQENYEKQREHLERARQLVPENPDIVIAMYRSPEAKGTYRIKVQNRLQEMKYQMEQDIQNEPTSPNVYNQWAWLISNTEGDFKLAVKRSKLSLELSPENPSYLDTLGRCYYAAGDLENAVKAQRQAIALHPHLMIMQRQLRQFEETLEAQKQKEENVDRNAD